MNLQTIQLLSNLGLASVMVSVTVMIHFWGLLLLTYVMSESRHRLRPHESRIHQAVLIIFVVFGIFALVTIHIWLYAALFRLLGEVPNFESALYFSTTTFTAVGYGDILISPRWRLVAAIEAANGVILLAWSTAFLLSVTSRLRMLEHDWLERRD
ncbi:MAG: two pore domain potassium channel family protein [Proteobacteria bacterium]|nr:two pore domain potassium channel family protein [Pseudomonadota bacterium]